MISQSATYRDIENCVRQHHGFVPRTCWIAHCKELNGLPVKSLYQGSRLQPVRLRPAIEEAFRHFGMLP